LFARYLTNFEESSFDCFDNGLNYTHCAKMRRLLLCLIPLASATLLEKPADLTYEQSNETYCPGGTPFKLQTLEAKVRENGHWYASNNITSPEHCGTHLDAPAHITKGGLTVEQIPLGSLLTAGVLVNVTDEVGDNTNYTLPVSKLEEWEHKNGLIPQNAVVIVCFGWTSRWLNKTAFFGPTDEDLQFPGLSKEAAEWLAKKEEVIGVGVDTPSVDVGSSKTLDAHVILTKRNIYLLENVKLNETLPVLFNLAVMPMKIKNGTGAPVRLFAMKPLLVDPEKIPGGKNATEEQINRVFGSRRGGFFPIPIPIPIPFGGFGSKKNKYKSYPGYSNYGGYGAGAGMMGAGLLGGAFGGSNKHGQGYYPGQGQMGYPGQGHMAYPGQSGFPGGVGGYPGGGGGMYPGGAGGYPGGVAGAYPGAGSYPGGGAGGYPGAAPGYQGAYPGGAPPAYPGGGAPAYPGGAAPSYPGGAPPPYPGGAPPAYPGGAPPAYPGGAPPYPGGSGSNQGAPPAYGPAVPSAPLAPGSNPSAPASPMGANKAAPYPGGAPPAYPGGAPPAYGPAVPSAPASPVGGNKPAPYPQQKFEVPGQSPSNAAKPDPIGFKQSVVNPPASSGSAASKPKETSNWFSGFSSSRNNNRDPNGRDNNSGRRKSSGRRGGGSRRRH